MLNRFTTLAALFGLFLLSGVSAKAADNDTSGGEGPAKSGGSSQRTSIVIITIERGTSNTFPESQLPETQLPQSQLMTTDFPQNSITAVER